jgi:uncharacterized membrane protein YidH (DUF202 family)
MHLKDSRGTNQQLLRYHSAGQRMEPDRKRARLMRGTVLIAMLLIVGGIAALAVPYFTYTQKERVVDVGPIQIDADKTKQVNIPQIAAIAALIAGLALLFASRRADA